MGLLWADFVDWPRLDRYQTLQGYTKGLGTWPEWREKARVQMVAWFDVCPDPDVVSRGRRYLGMYLN